MPFKKRAIDKEEFAGECIQRTFFSTCIGKCALEAKSLIRDQLN